jgi:molybdopterin-binding protein
LLQARGGSRQKSSARNRLPGVVVSVVRDGVMAQVEMSCGDHRIVSLMSREAADDLELDTGVQAVAVVKATNVIIER